MSADLVQEADKPPFYGETGAADADRTSAVRGYAFVTVLNLAAWGVITWQLRDPTRGAFRLELPPTAPPPTVSVAATPTRIRVVVHVAGAVARPGLVYLAEGARIADAVEAAGGFAGDADQARVNLAQTVGDGALLLIPRPGDGAESDGAAGLVGSGAESGAPDGGQGVVLAGGTAPDRASNTGSGLVNVNTATAAELEQLPGIGPGLAGRIVAHREKNGPFRSVESLLDVSGIGPSVLAKIETLVRLE